jgi:hypothetical protein
MKGASVDTRVTKCYPLVLGDCLKEEEWTRCLFRALLWLLLVSPQCLWIYKAFVVNLGFSWVGSESLSCASVTRLLGWLLPGPSPSCSLMMIAGRSLLPQPLNVEWLSRITANCIQMVPIFSRRPSARVYYSPCHVSSPSRSGDSE